MIASTVYFKVLRKKTSHNFRKGKKDSWEGDTNAQHNMEDAFQLFENGQVIFSAPVQTVANMPDCRHEDTILPGLGWLRWNVAPRSFKGHVHGLVGFKDQDGQYIDENSVTPIPGKNGAPADWLRCLVHSTEKREGSGVTRFAWSAACFIMTPEKLEELYILGFYRGFTDNELIPLYLEEVDVAEVATEGATKEVAEEAV